jgi:hypothetical protein
LRLSEKRETSLHKGDLIQLSDGEQCELKDALPCYQQGADLAPESAEAFESIGFFFDAIESDPVRAESAFRRLNSEADRIPMLD